MNYDVQFFIDKFSAIPEHEWCTYDIDNGKGQHCAWGHIRYSEKRSPDNFCEGAALSDMLVKSGLNQYGDPSAINNGDDARYQHATPKQRILAALQDIKAMTKDIDTGGKKERIVYVSVLASITEQSKDLVLS